MLNAQVGPVFLTYQAEKHIDELINTVTESEPEYDFILGDGIRHTFWVVSDAETLNNIEQAFVDVPCLYVADGHHRSAAATRIKNMRQQANANHDGSEAYNNFLRNPL